MARTLRVAFAMGGGASLGAFSGGAIVEVVRQLHTNLDRTRYDRFEIDVLSGASAGGMTVGLLVRALADPAHRTASEAVEHLHTAMHQAWVEQIDLEGLVPAADMTGPPSLFDRGAVDAIARSLLAWPEGARPGRTLLGPRVCLGLTLLNYNGIPISLSREPALGDALGTTLFRDYRVYCLDLESADAPVPSRWRHLDGDALADPRAWKAMAATMIAGGAVPVAFEPVVLKRLRSEYGALWPAELEGREAFRFTHGDGGTFDNEPLRQAMRMIGFMDAGVPTDTFDRILISIDPNVSGSVHDFSLDFHRSHEINPDFGLFDGEDVVPADFAGRLLSNAGRVLTALRGQASYKDYLGADKVNNRLRWRDDARSLISDLIGALDPDRVAGLARSAERTLERVLADKQQASTVPNTALELATELQRVHAELEADAGQEVPDRLDDPAMLLECALLSLFDQVAALRGKQPVSVWAIAPTTWVPPGGEPSDAVPVELAGDFASSFGGFFDQSYREHDFRLGAAVAGSVLAQPPASGPLGSGLLADPSGRASLPAPLDPGLGTNEEARRRFADRLGHVAEAVLKTRLTNRLMRLLAAPRVRGAVAGLVDDPGPARVDALLRVVLRTNDGPGGSFHLEASEGGDDSEGVTVRENGRAELYTVVRFSPEGASVIDGPHVHRTAAGPVLLVRRKVAGRPDPAVSIPLPLVAELRAVMPFGLPVHEADLDWAEGSISGWIARNALVALDEEL
jgi:predicted acylesterase/phospholipase RssA